MVIGQETADLITLGSTTAYDTQVFFSFKIEKTCTLTTFVEPKLSL